MQIRVILSDVHMEGVYIMNQKKTWNMPHTFVIVFFVVLFSAILTFIVPVGMFQTEEITYTLNGEENTRTVIQPGSFEFLKDENGHLIRQGAALFKSGGETGFLNYVFEGLTSGDKWGSAVGVVAFILVIGGAFGIVMKTRAIEESLLSVISKSKGKEIFLIPILFFLFSLGGAVFGMGEEAIAFAFILAPMMVTMGYDGLTAVLITYIATQIGFATSWMNPFSVAIAQGVSGVPVLSGSGLRIIMWIVFTLIGIIFTWRHAVKVKKDPMRSLSYHSDQSFHSEEAKDQVSAKFSFGHILVLLTLLLGIIWIVWGVTERGYYIPEIATQFFTIGLVSGFIAIVFKLNNMRINDLATSFTEGAKDLLPAALVVGMAKGIVLILGGDSPDTPSVLNTALYGAGELIGDFPNMLSATFMYLFQSVFNFFVVSGSAQAALTMPLMAPLADIAGVTRQVAVLAFQLGDGLTNIIVPTSASLLGTLGAARVDWGIWAKFIYKFLLLLMAISIVFIMIAVVIGY